MVSSPLKADTSMNSVNYRFYSYGDACLLFLHSVFERSGTGSREENASNKS